MQLHEFKALLGEAEKTDRYIEAFSIKSLYVESIIVVLAVSIEMTELGFDGNKKSVAKSIATDPKIKKLYEQIIKRDLKDNINVLKKLPAIQQKDKGKAIDHLHTWRNHRNEVFHNFAEFMLQGKLEEECKKHYAFLKRITAQLWFQNIETSFKITQANLPSPTR